MVSITGGLRVDGHPENDSIAGALREIRLGSFLRGTRSEGSVALNQSHAVTQVSDEPVLVAVSIGNGEPTLRVIQDSGVFSVNLMAQDHDEKTPTVGASDSYLLGRHTECPILPNAVAWLECRVRLTVPVGDHTLVIGRVLDGERVGDYDG